MFSLQVYHGVPVARGAKDGNFLQDLLIDEGVAAVDALSRAAVLWM